jgi:RNA polymerase sigma-70 factor (ECF subfamily)
MERGSMTEQELMAIYRDTVHPLYGYLSKRTGGNRVVTEDIVQETYLAALGAWKVKAVPETPLAWLKQVARNILVDQLRRKKREHELETRLEPAARRETADGGFESLELFRALTSLGRKKARILEAFYFDGKSVLEIAAEMALSARAVEGHLRRGRQALKPLLADPKSNGETHA